MADLKATSFRIGEEDLEKFKEFMEQEGIKTQADGFKVIMQSVEMAQAKNLIKDRAKEVEVFQDTINRLMGYYLNSLEVNQNSEERIREELSKELSTKDNTISTMYEQLQEVKVDNKCLNEDLTNAQNQIDISMKSIKDLNDNVKNLKGQLEIANRNNNNLQEQVAEYKQDKDNYKTIEKELEQLKADSSNKDNDINQLNNDNKQLQDKINNSVDMITFYKEEIENKDKSINEYKNDIKSLEAKKDKEIENMKSEHEKYLQDQIKAITEQLNNRHDVDAAKKDLEVEKLKNEIANLKSKGNKTVINKKSNTIEN
jgi:chromosome segregation ATPase